MYSKSLVIEKNWKITSAVSQRCVSYFLCWGDSRFCSLKEATECKFREHCTRGSKCHRRAILHAGRMQYHPLMC